METSDKLQFKGLLSPEPKRIAAPVIQVEFFDLFRSRSCEVPDQILISELNEILGKTFQSPDRNSSPLFSKFSKTPPERDRTNPIVSDEKFILLDFSLSTSEESGSDSDRVISSL